MPDNAKPTLLLIDGHSLAFRAFYALSPDSFRTSSGQHTNAVHGFISMLLNILQAEKPTHLAVAFDLSRSSFRTEEYPEYKGTRGETPPEFNGQTELLQMALKAMNIRTLTRENFEADDILASLSDQASAAGFNVFIVSGDRDTFQLISESSTILYPVKGVLNLARMTDEAVYEKYGVHANQYSDLAALVGETSDNLPGIPGVGPKTAAKWLQTYNNLDGVLAAADEITGKVGESLREHRELAVRNRRLNHLIRDLDMGVTFDELALGSVDEAEVKRVFAELQFKSLTERVLRLRGASGSQTNGSAASASEPELSDDTAESAHEEISKHYRSLEMPAAKEIDSQALMAWLSQQTSTVGIGFDHAGDTVVAVGFATETERFDWNNKSNAEVSEILGAWLSDASRIKAGFDSKNLIRLVDRLTDSGISGLNYDPFLFTYLLNPIRRNYELDDIALEYLGLKVEREQGDLFAKGSAKASTDAWLSLVLSELQHRMVTAEDQLRVYTEVELPTSETLARMEELGIKVDSQKLQSLFDELTHEVSEIAKDAYALIGREINLASPKQLQTVLFDELGMTGTKSIKTGFSTNAEALATLFEQTQHPFLEKLLAHRDATKIRQMVETLLKSIDDSGRIHTSYVQTGTSTGRISSENPNLQNIPIKSAKGREIRDAFVVTEGFETLLTADYSQIEMRIMAHLSEDEGLIEAFNTGEDLHRFVGSRIFGVEPSEVTPAMRSKVKAMSYGLVYGLSEYGLAKQLRISNAEAKQLMADYFTRFGGVRRYLASVVDDAKIHGFTSTQLGRRRPFPDLKSPIFQLRENARRAVLNAPIQGTAADIMKLAMNSVAREIASQNLSSRMLLQVHDELVFEVANGEVEALKNLVINAMQNAATLSVPLEVQIGLGHTWDEAGH
jgi:DNA polymerase-1